MQPKRDGPRKTAQQAAADAAAAAAAARREARYVDHVRSGGLEPELTMEKRHALIHSHLEPQLLRRPRDERPRTAGARYRVAAGAARADDEFLDSVIKQGEAAEADAQVLAQLSNAFDRVLTRDMSDLGERPQPNALYESDAWAQLRARGSGSRKDAFGAAARGPKALLISRLPTGFELPAKRGKPAGRR